MLVAVTSRRDWAHPATSAPGINGLAPAQICTGNGLTPPTSAPELGSPLTTSAPGLGAPLPASPRCCAAQPSYRRRAHRRASGVSPPPAHICTRTGLAPPTSAPGLRYGGAWNIAAQVAEDHGTSHISVTSAASAFGRLRVAAALRAACCMLHASALCCNALRRCKVDAWSIALR